jgi:hypothetical protein
MSPTASFIWALVPLYTIGFGTVVVLGWAAGRLRSRWLALCAVAAALVMVGALALPSGSSAAGGLIILGPVCGGLVATFVVRNKLVRPAKRSEVSSSAPPSLSTPPTSWSNLSASTDPAVQVALAHRNRRAEARRLLETDPALARELCIGRPDLPRQYDDGGIVDVNHAPVRVLAALPGFTPDLAARVADARERYGAFTLLQELEVYADIPEELANQLADRLIFLP